MKEFSLEKLFCIIGKRGRNRFEVVYEVIFQYICDTENCSSFFGWIKIDVNKLLWWERSFLSFRDDFEEISVNSGMFYAMDYRWLVEIHLNLLINGNTTIILHKPFHCSDKARQKFPSLFRCFRYHRRCVSTFYDIFSCFTMIQTIFSFWLLVGLFIQQNFSMNRIFTQWN